MLKALLTATLELLFRLWAGKWYGDKQVTKGTYDAKTAEANALAKPDLGWDDTVDRL